MKLNPIFELSMVLDTEKFQKIFDMAYNKTGYLKELDDEYLDTSLMEKGITVIYRDSQYKKRIRLLINLSLVVDDPSDTDKLLRKLDKRIGKYFNFKHLKSPLMQKFLQKSCARWDFLFEQMQSIDT